jgi:hypothetical protein
MCNRQIYPRVQTCHLDSLRGPNWWKLILWKSVKKWFLGVFRVLLQNQLWSIGSNWPIKCVLDRATLVCKHATWTDLPDLIGERWVYMGNVDTAILPYPWGGPGRWYGDPSVNVWASIQTHGLIFEIDGKTSRSNRPCFRSRRVKNTVVLTGAISTQGGTLGVMVPHTNFWDVAGIRSMWYCRCIRMEQGSNMVYGHPCWISSGSPGQTPSKVPTPHHMYMYMYKIHFFAKSTFANEVQLVYKIGNRQIYPSVQTCHLGSPLGPNWWKFIFQKTMKNMKNTKNTLFSTFLQNHLWPIRSVWSIKRALDRWTLVRKHATWDAP